MNGKMNKFSKGKLNVSFNELCQRFPSVSHADLEREYNRLLQDEIWLNDEYQVNVTKCKDYTHLSIKRLDKESLHDWRDLQTIKNMLIGEEAEAIELYPAESRLVDTANQYHLWYLHPDGVPMKLNFGFKNRSVEDIHPEIANIGQRKF